MFTGIIEELGTVRNIRKKSDSAILEIGANKIFKEMSIGDSLAVNGACLTIVKLNEYSFSFDVINETLDSTNLKFLKAGDRVNLERPLKLSSLLSGHLISGHIDYIGRIAGLKKTKDIFEISIRIPDEFMEFVIPKGSIAVDGVSLTVSNIENDTFSVCLIPFTETMTTLGLKKKQDFVNIELDIIGKYVKYIIRGKKEAVTEEFLRERGFL